MEFTKNVGLSEIPMDYADTAPLVTLFLVKRRSLFTAKRRSLFAAKRRSLFTEPDAD